MGGGGGGKKIEMVLYIAESPRKSAVKHESNQDLDSNWDLEEEAVPAKRSKATLQATPRPSSPVQPYKSHKISE